MRTGYVLFCCFSLFLCLFVESSMNLNTKVCICIRYYGGYNCGIQYPTDDFVILHNFWVQTTLIGQSSDLNNFFVFIYFFIAKKYFNFMYDHYLIIWKINFNILTLQKSSHIFSKNIYLLTSVSQLQEIFKKDIS